MERILLDTSASPVRPLLPSDIEGAMALIRAAGWNQLPSDWLRLLSLQPEGCFALEWEGRLASTTTAVCYGRNLAWIGMVLTHPECRRRGFAEMVMERTLQFVDSRGIAVTKLDATESGFNLYRKFGFTVECEVERWRRIPGPVADVEEISPSFDPVFDRPRFGADRQALLTDLARLGVASLPDGSYAMGRSGLLSAYFGPCLATSPDAARTLLRWFLHRHAEESVFWDILPANRDAARIAEDFGFVPVRRLIRMRLSFGSEHALANHPDIYAIAGFELG